jgi:hypothetical protein
MNKKIKNILHGTEVAKEKVQKVVVREKKEDMYDTFSPKSD